MEDEAIIDNTPQNGASDEIIKGDDTTNTPPPEEPKVDEPVLFETPDGRQVTAEQLQVEWKENFMPEFTRKSQRLAELEKGTKEVVNDIPKWKEKDYIPDAYSEIVEIAKAEALKEIENKSRVERENQERISKEVESTLLKIKAKDPNLNENKLFEHALKYNFQNLEVAYQNMADINKIKEIAEKNVLENLKSKNTLKVATDTAKVDSATNNNVDYNSLNLETPQEYLRRIKK